MAGRNMITSFFFVLLIIQIMEGRCHLFKVFTIFIDVRKIRFGELLFLENRTFYFFPFHQMIFEARIFEGINRVKINLYHSSTIAAPSTTPTPKEHIPKK